MGIQDPDMPEQHETGGGSDMNSAGPDGGKNGANGIPKWLGWMLVLAIVMMMAAALVLGARRLQEAGAIAPPTPTSMPSIGSMEVEPQLETTAGEAPEQATDERDLGGESGQVDGSTSPAEENEPEAKEEGRISTAEISGIEGVDPEYAVLAGAELLVTAERFGTVVVLPASLRDRVPLAPTATDIPATSGSPVEPVPVATTFGRFRATQPAETPATLRTTEMPTATGVPTETATPTATATPTPTAQPTMTATATATTVENSDLESLVPGSVVVGRVSVLVLHTEASKSSLVMETYVSGTEFEVLEPLHNSGSYPVVVDGGRWIRVRAEDGLVGWVAVEDILVEN
jgi:hypothetical protein